MAKHDTTGRSPAEKHDDMAERLHAAWDGVGAVGEFGPGYNGPQVTVYFDALPDLLQVGDISGNGVYRIISVRTGRATLSHEAAVLVEVERFPGE